MCHVKSPIHRLSDCPPSPEQPKYYYYSLPVPSMYCCCCCCCPDVGPLRTLRGQHRGDATHGALGANNNSDVSGNDSTVFAGRASVGARSGKMQTQSFAEAGGTQAPIESCHCLPCCSKPLTISVSTARGWKQFSKINVGMAHSKSISFCIGLNWIM